MATIIAVEGEEVADHFPLKDTLEGIGHLVIRADNNQDAIRKYASDSSLDTLVLLDEENGLDDLLEVRQINQYAMIGIIIQSIRTKEQEQAMVTTLVAGATGFINKPFDSIQVTKEVSRMLPV